MALKSPVVCLAHLRWAFTYQRPNHLMVRFAHERRVFYIEEPLFDSSGGLSSVPHMRALQVEENLWVCTPHLLHTSGDDAEDTDDIVARLLASFLQEHGVVSPVLWFYTPMALPLTHALHPSVVVYDCMDELSLFLGAPKELIARERQLFDKADLVFTGGHSLYQAKRGQHPNVHAFPSSVDTEHFRSPGVDLKSPPDQAGIPQPRIGFFGVIDERMDLELLEKAARERPTYQFVIVGPVVKITDQTLPRVDNIHYLGSKLYAQLPAYLHGWDVAIMPFALNDATRFISPTKTLEYFAAGKPVVSTAVQDVVVPYGELGLVSITNAEGFALALDQALALTPSENVERAAVALKGTSWDQTWSAMAQLIEQQETQATPKSSIRQDRPTQTKESARV